MLGYLRQSVVAAEVDIGVDIAVPDIGADTVEFGYTGAPPCIVVGIEARARAERIGPVVGRYMPAPAAAALGKHNAPHRQPRRPWRQQ